LSEGVAQPKLVGREQELAGAEAALAESAAARVVVVSGEAGIGKTRLLAELRTRADEAGMVVLGGRGAEFERELPFGAFVDALDDYLASRGSGWSQSIESSGSDDERQRLHAAVRGLLEQLAAEKPLVLALDDLHWADEATIELLSHLLRRPPQAPVVLLLSFRSGQPPARLLAAIEDARRDGLLTSIELEPLSREHARELLGARLDDAAERELYRLSGGNPFYLEELSRFGGIGEHGGAGPETGAGVPAPVAAALRRELDELPQETRVVARGAAVAGESFEPELVAAAASIPVGDVTTGIDDLLDRDVIRRTEAPRRFRFRHPIVHGAVYEEAKPGWRLEAHSRVAAALEASGAEPLARARHIECSAAAGDDAAIAVLRDAGAAAGLRAPAAAAHWYGAARRLAGGADPGTRLSLLVPMAQALGYSGRLEEARATLDEVLAIVPADQHAIRGQIASSAARIDQLHGRHAAAREILLEALNGVPPESVDEAAQLKLQLAAACFFEGDFHGLRRWVNQALRDPQAAADPATQAAATGLLGCAEYMTGDCDEARRRLDEAELLFERLTAEQLGEHHSLTWTGICEIYLERFDRAVALFERAMAVAEATGHGHMKTLNRIGLGLVYLWRGQIAPATELLDDAVEGATLTGNDQFLTWALWGRCWAATLAGDLDDALRIGDQAVQRLARGVADPVSAMAGAYCAEAKLEAGEPPAEARSLLLDAAGGEEMPLIEVAFRARWYELLTRIEIAAADLEAAARWSDLAGAASVGLGIEGRSADAQRAVAALALARGDSQAAAEAAQRATELATSAGLPIDAARAQTLAGRALADTDAGKARQQLETAVRRLDSLGAAHYRDDAAQALRSLGGKVRRPKRARGEIGEGIGSLSGREREVSDLVAAGRTNKEIAAELYLSEKTIEKHMSKIFEKLGASKRAQVAALIGREREPA
jgi:ATP/maltotriose-dependent transcriptional regulator MalT